MRSEQLSFPGIPAPPGPPAVDPEQAALQGRLERRERARARWRSSAKRVQDDSGGGPSDYPEGTDMARPHTDGNLQAGESFRRGSVGSYLTPFARPTNDYPPMDVTFQGSYDTAWRQHAKVEEVPLHSLRSYQNYVSAQRVDELLDNPDAGDTGRIPGQRVLPKVFRFGREDSLMDGNHRATAAVLRGEMFVPARVATMGDVPAMAKTNARIKGASDDALEGRDHQWVHERWQNLVETGETDPYDSMGPPNPSPSPRAPHPVFDQLAALGVGPLGSHDIDPWDSSFDRDKPWQTGAEDSWPSAPGGTSTRRHLRNGSL